MKPRKTIAFLAASFAASTFSPQIFLSAVVIGIALVALLAIAQAAPTAPASEPAPARGGHSRVGMVRPYGMPPLMFADYVRACYQAGVNPRRVTQTIGRASASAGTHYRDGTLPENGIRYDYCAALDLRSRDLSDHQRRLLLSKLASNGFAGWYRNRGSFSSNRHFHVVYTRYHMKAALRAQVHDWMQGRTGLVGHARETFWQSTPAQKARLRAWFLKTNPVKN